MNPLSTPDPDTLRIAILTTDRPTYSPTLAEGLARMLRRLSVPPHLYYNGLSMLFSPLFGRPGSISSYRNLLSHCRFLLSLRRHNLVIVVMTVPDAFRRSFRVSRLRRLMPRVPIVQYSSPFIGSTRGGMWIDKLKAGFPGYPTDEIRSGGNPGMERYDWYLCASATSSEGLPADAPVSIIGLDIDDGTLYPQQGKEFVALLDFERTSYLAERAVQIMGLLATEARLIALSGTYTRDAIRRIYRTVNVYFPAWPESFGLPICELQLCGAYVFVPHADWACAHWIKDVHAPGPGRLSDNFVIYDNNINKLITALQNIKSAYEPKKVVTTFTNEQPHFVWGDIDALRSFLVMVQSGAITSESHLRHVGWRLESPAGQPAL